MRLVASALFAVLSVIACGTPPEGDAAHGRGSSLREANINRAPDLEVDPSLPNVVEGVPVHVVVFAYDPDGDTVSLTAPLLPTGSTFVQRPSQTQNNAIGDFDWKEPTVAGAYRAVFVASDDGDPPQTDTATVTILVRVVSVDGSGDEGCHCCGPIRPTRWGGLVLGGAFVALMLLAGRRRR